MGKIVICGDSFAIGIGVQDLLTDAWGPIISKEYKKEVINFAKGSSTNYSISLQADYAIENIQNIDLLIISDTCEHRINFFKYEEHIARSSNSWNNSNISNLDINYHEYPPYGPGTYHQTISHPYINNPEYKGTLNTENWYGVVEYTDRLLEKEDTSSTYYKKFKEDDERLLLLRDYYFKISDTQIQRKQDVGCLLYSYLKAKKLNIPVLMAMEKDEIKDLIPFQDYVDLSWGQLALKYPDTIGTLHTSEEGQSVAAAKVIEHIDKFNILKNG